MTTLNCFFPQKKTTCSFSQSQCWGFPDVLQELRFWCLWFRCHIPPPKLFWKFSRLRRFGHFGMCSILSCKRKWHNFAHNCSTRLPFGVLWFGFMYQQLLVHVSWFGSMPTSPSAHKTLRTCQAVFFGMAYGFPRIPACPTLFTSHGSCIWTSHVSEKSYKLKDHQTRWPMQCSQTYCYESDDVPQTKKNIFQLWKTRSVAIVVEN